jgi:hypothetical protein
MAINERSLRWRHPDGRRITFAELHALELPEGCRKDGLDLDLEEGTFAAVAVRWPKDVERSINATFASLLERWSTGCRKPSERQRPRLWLASR